MQSHEDISAAIGASRLSRKSGRRARIPLSCDQCRTRKLKCNREKPCQNCTARAEQASCKYKGSKSASRPVETPSPLEKTNAMQQRIDELENLVKVLMVQNRETPPQGKSHSPNNIGLGLTTASHHAIKAEGASLDLPCSQGTTLIDRGQSVYKSANDWSNLLGEVIELKKGWNRTDIDVSDHRVQRLLPNTFNGAGVLSSQVKSVEMSELLATIPPKPKVDELILQFFDRKNFAISVAPILHEPTFMHEYAEHWRDPSGTSVIWLGLLFSILSIVMLSYHQFSNEPSEYKGRADALYELYRLCTAQCLIIGDVAKCLPYTIETLLFNSTAELSRKDDSGRGLWMMTGIMVRAAINMGYHRDPSQTPSLSVLQGELRRRIWLALVGKDNLASFLIGFPSMMSAINSDTLEPRNLHDWELSHETSVLPPSRPLVESTPVTYLIVKGRLMRALGCVADFNNALKPGSYDQVRAIDRSLHEAFEYVPLYLGMPSSNIADSGGRSPVSDSATSVSMLQMQFLYHQGMCALHRNFLTRGRIDGQYGLSRDRCVSSALALLDQQHAFHQSSLPSQKTLSPMPQWYEISHARQTFILAAMILCLDLEYQRRGGTTTTTATTTMPPQPPGSGDLLRVLRRSCAIWEDVKASSDDARRVHEVLTSMLLSLNETAAETGSSSLARVPSSRLGFEQQQQRQQPRIMMMNRQPSSPLLTHGGMSLTEDVDVDVFEASNEMGMEMGMEIDWALWDSFIEGASFEEVYESNNPFNDTDLS